MLFGILIRMLRVRLHGMVNHLQDNLNNIVIMSRRPIHAKVFIDTKKSLVRLLLVLHTYEKLYVV